MDNKNNDSKNSIWFKLLLVIILVYFAYLTITPFIPRTEKAFVSDKEISYIPAMHPYSLDQGSYDSTVNNVDDYFKLLSFELSNINLGDSERTPVYYAIAKINLCWVLFLVTVAIVLIVIAIIKMVRYFKNNSDEDKNSLKKIFIALAILEFIIVNRPISWFWT